MGKQIEIIDRLINEGYFVTRDEALPFIMSGAVYCGGVQIVNGGQRVKQDAPIRVKGLGERYIGKGGYKLEGALKTFAIEVKNRVCIDAGACTGGFTDCLIKHGAARVYAVEVGFGQLHGSLALNERVVNLERTNIGDKSLLELSPAPTLGSVDLSYLSLVKAVPQFRAVMHDEGELCCLVKPLFETDDAEARRTGELQEGEYLPLLKRLAAELNAQPLTSVTGITHSPVTGNNGTREFFMHVVFGAGVAKPELGAEAERAVEQVLALESYRRD